MDSVFFILMSNSVYVFEILAGILLLFRRTRVHAVLAAIAFVFMIECAARELTFGALMVNLVLLFLPGAWIKRLLPFFVIYYGYLVAMKVGIFPMFEYSPA